LHGVGAQQDELRRVAARFYAADAAQTAAGELRLNHLGDLHHHS
jgi:hypothetical protein